MFFVKAKATTVVIGERVFSPVLATPFHGELPPDVAGQSDLLLIEEVPDEQPKVAPGGLSASGTMETASGAGGADTDAQGGPEGSGEGDAAGTAGDTDTGAKGSPEGPGEGGGEAESSRVNPLTVDSDGDGHGALGPDGLPSIHHDGADLDGPGQGGAADSAPQGGPEGPDGQGDGSPSGGPDPDPFADLTEGPNAGGARQAPAPTSAAPPRTGGGGKGGRSGRK